MNERERQLIYDALCEVLFYAEDNGGFYQCNYSVDEIRNLADKYKPQYENNVELDNAAENYTDSSEWLPGENLEHLDAAFKAGAKWMAEQGKIFDGEVISTSDNNWECIRIYEKIHSVGDKVIVQIRKKEESK